MDYKRVNNDVNGNSRYVFHFLDFLSEQEQTEIKEKAAPLEYVKDAYRIALNKARDIGGRKYRGNDFGGGIVIQSHNVYNTIAAIKKLKSITL